MKWIAIGLLAAGLLGCAHLPESGELKRNQSCCVNPKLRNKTSENPIATTPRPTRKHVPNAGLGVIAEYPLLSLARQKGQICWSFLAWPELKEKCSEEACLRVLKQLATINQIVIQIRLDPTMTVAEVATALRKIHEAGIEYVWIMNCIEGTIRPWVDPAKLLDDDPFPLPDDSIPSKGAIGSPPQPAP